MYQFFALHALHQSLKEVDGIALTKVEGFLNGCDNVGLHSVRKSSAEELQYNMITVTLLKTHTAILGCFVTHWAVVRLLEILLG